MRLLSILLLALLTPVSAQVRLDPNHVDTRSTWTWHLGGVTIGPSGALTATTGVFGTLTAPLTNLTGTLAVGKGGTGSSTAAGARTALGVPGLGSNNTFTGTQMFSDVVTFNEFTTNSSDNANLVLKATGGTPTVILTPDDTGIDLATTHLTTTTVTNAGVTLAVDNGLGTGTAATASITGGSDGALHTSGGLVTAGAATIGGVITNTGLVTVPTSNGTATTRVTRADGTTTVFAVDTLNNRLTLPSGVVFASGAGSPEGAVAAPVGSLYTRTDGGASTTLYVKTGGGSGNTGWTAK